MRHPWRLARAAPLLVLTACVTVHAPEETEPGRRRTAAPAAEAASPAEEATLAGHRVEVDTPLRTPSGAAFLVPAGWTVTGQEGRFTLEDPERELRVTLLEVPGPSATRAITEAWAWTRPGFTREPQQVLRPPPHDGWDELLEVHYAPAPQEARRVVALARRRGSTSYVALLDGGLAAMDRRSAQVSRVVLGFKPPALEEESFAGRRAHPLTPGRLAALEAFVEEGRRRLGIPGAALAVVQDGRVVAARGFGVRALGGAEPVTPETLFLVGSTTKSLTTLLMARLVDQGRLAWDTPVTRLLPSFALADAEVTRRLTLQDTVCACTGLPRQDMEMLFEYAGVTADARIAEMRSMRPTTGIGETFQYSNPMVSAGGYMAAHAWLPELPLDQAYDRAMQALVFGPLGMEASTFDFERAARADHAVPHGRGLALEAVPLPLEVERALLPVRPAGGAWSNVRDLARYLLLELGEGRLPGAAPLVSAANLLERRRPRVRASDTASYGLGLFVEEDHGVRVVGHGGNTLGFSADLFLLPGAGVGVALLTNVQGDGPFREAVRRKLLELLYDGQPLAEAQLAFAWQARQEQAARERSRLASRPDAAWLHPLLGSYRHPGLGRITLRRGPRGPVLDAGEWQSAVGERVEPDGTRKLVLLDPPYAGLELLPRGGQGRTALALELPQQRYLFESQEAQSRDTP